MYRLITENLGRRSFRATLGLAKGCEPMAGRSAAIFLLCCMAIIPAAAQINQLTNETATPIPGAGHDYRKLLNETVNPANGSVSVRISIPPPASRGFTLPFSINYDSAGLEYFSVQDGVGSWSSGDSSAFLSGGWSYSTPVLTSTPLTYLIPNGPPGQDPNPTQCNGQYNYMFTDPSGERHSFAGLTYFLPWPNNSRACPNSFPSDGDSRYIAHLDSSTGNVKVFDHDGTVYNYVLNQAQQQVASRTPQVVYLPTQIEDRNGNVTVISQSGDGNNTALTVTDSSGRAALSWNGFGRNSSVTVAGLAPIQINWDTTTSQFTPTYNHSGSCVRTYQPNDSHTVVTSIVLPNGQSYQFQYDGIYGLISKIVYPNGAYSRYVWGLNLKSDLKGAYQTQGNSQTSCIYTYDTPAVQHHYVSYDGVNEVLQEDYSYLTTPDPNQGWSSKTTTVASSVGVVQGSSVTAVRTFSTLYTYTPYPEGQNPYDAVTLAINLMMPLEQSTVHRDASGNTTLRSETKTWSTPQLLASQSTTLDSQVTSQVQYTYNYGEVASEVTYDYGSSGPGNVIKQVGYTYPPLATAPNGAYILDRPCQVITYDGSGGHYAETDYYYDGGADLCGQSGAATTAPVANLTGHDEANYGSTSQAIRGNVTRQVRQTLQSGGTSVTSYAYDESGQLTSVTDPNGNVTSYSFADSYKSGFGTPPAQTNTYMTTITRPTVSGVPYTLAFQYRYNDGQLSAATDQNSQTTSYAYNDPWLRLTESDFPDGGKTTISYNDSGSNPTQTVSQLLSGSVSKTTTTVMDGVGHPIQTQLTSDPQGTIYADMVYDGSGKVFTSSTPYRHTSDSTYGVTTFNYDALGRTTQTQTSDGSISESSYSANSTTTFDQARKMRRFSTDALGRLINVNENPSNESYNTSYSYDPLGDLVQVNQSNQVRKFGYDGLRQLSWSLQPETGAINYRYDAAGNLIWRDDNLGQQTCYSYDALNRPVQKVYYVGSVAAGGSGNCAGIPVENLLASTPAVSYVYGSNAATSSIGRLDHTATGSVATYFSYDAMGRVRTGGQATHGTWYPFVYSYDLAGSLIAETYPSGRTVNTAYDSAGHATQVSGTYGSQSRNYVTGASYAPHGTLSSFAYGNGLTRSFSYNSRLQTVAIEDDNPGNPAANPVLQLQLYWGDGQNLTGHNNGNLVGQYTGTHYGAGNNWASYWEGYSYDNLNRIQQVTDNGGANGGAWQRTFAYDPYGNMAVASNDAALPLNQATPLSLSAYNTATNQLNGPAFDAAGNQSGLGSGALAEAFAYDGENRMLTATSNGATTTYTYDGQGNRVMKSGPNGATTVYVYDAFNQLAAEYTTVANTPSCLPCYLSWDHLGSTRMVTDQYGQVVSRHDYLPFGEELTSGYAGRPNPWGGTADDVNQKFTGKQRDAESGLDYFGARYYGSALGRFTSPDWNATPEPIPYADLSDPQTLNLYVYVRNNPLAHPDADGHCCEEAMQFGQELTAAPSPLMEAAGYAVIGGAAIGTALTNPKIQQAVVDALPNLGGGGGQYGDFSRQMHITTASQTNESAASEVDTVRQGKREAMRQEGIPTSQQPDSQISTEGGRQAVYTVPKPGGGKQTKVVTVNHNDSSHPGQTHVEAGNAKANGQTDSTGRQRVVNDKTKINVKRPDGQQQ